MESNGQNTESQGVIVTDAETANVDANGADEVHITEVEASSPEQAEVKQEEKKEEAPVQNEEDKRFSVKFAALSRKEKQIKQREKELADRERKLQELQEASNKPVEVQKEEEPFDLSIRKNTLETLAKYGITQDDLVNIMLNNGKMTPEMELQYKIENYNRQAQKKIEELEAKLSKQEEEAQRKREELAKQEEEQAIINFKDKIKNFVGSNKEAYELIEAEEADDLVFDVIENHYAETGEILDIKIAADEVENLLLEQARKKLKLKKLSQSMEADLKPASKEEPKKEVKASTTLSNSQSQQQSVASGSRQLSRDESLAEAAKLLKWNQE